MPAARNSGLLRTTQELRADLACHQAQVEECMDLKAARAVGALPSAAGPPGLLERTMTFSRKMRKRKPNAPNTPPTADPTARGGVYTGDSNAVGEAEGEGVYRGENGEYYEGEWAAGAKHGHGVYRHPSGRHYEGQWVRGKREGKGTNHYANGDV